MYLPNGPYDLADDGSREEFYEENVQFYQAVITGPDGETVWESEICKAGWSDQNEREARIEGQLEMANCGGGCELELLIVGHQWRANGPDPMDYPED
jgi:hypothetical protein